MTRQTGRRSRPTVRRAGYGWGAAGCRAGASAARPDHPPEFPVQPLCNVARGTSYRHGLPLSEESPRYRRGAAWTAAGRDPILDTLQRRAAPRRAERDPINRQRGRTQTKRGGTGTDGTDALLVQLSAQDGDARAALFC